MRKLSLGEENRLPKVTYSVRAGAHTSLRPPWFQGYALVSFSKCVSQNTVKTTTPQNFHAQLSLRNADLKSQQVSSCSSSWDVSTRMTPENQLQGVWHAECRVAKSVSPQEPSATELLVRAACLG